MLPNEPAAVFHVGAESTLIKPEPEIPALPVAEVNSTL